MDLSLLFLKKKENLIEKTVKELERLYQREFLVSIDLKKNLPISSGMGGGSSNSATVIRCIRKFLVSMNLNILRVF